MGGGGHQVVQRSYGVNPQLIFLLLEVGSLLPDSHANRDTVSLC